ncbi:MAG: DUF2334 domain-containing protein [Acidobacteria bacterium]|jgi:predicted deacetylase|nr:MAG: DUF2334 domain-containing protein [Acidobacteriota bacterium]
MDLAIIEVHDVNPFYKREFLRALELLDETSIDNFSLLVVPNFRGEKSVDGEFASIIKSIGGEVLLHGYYHTSNRRLRYFLWTDGEGEFGGLSLEETYRRVEEGVELLGCWGLSSKFFVPPAWIGNPYLEDVLYSFGFLAVAYRWAIKSLTQNSALPAPALTLSNRHMFSWLSLQLVPALLKVYKHQRVIRVALHCADFKDQRKEKLWRNILREIKNSRRLTSYGELFGKGGPSPSLQGFQPTGRMV